MIRAVARKTRWGRAGTVLLLTLAVVALSGCGSLRDFKGLNSLPLPGRAGQGPDSYTIQVQMADVQNLRMNSRVRVADVNVGNVKKIERQDWHALLTISLEGDVDLPANATARLGQTSLLGSMHIELAPPTDAKPEGKLKDGSVIPLASTAAFPSTEETLSALALVTNGGGLGHVHDITTALSTAFTGREGELRSLIGELDTFIAFLDDQKGDIISATESLNSLAVQFADEEAVLDEALRTIPDALEVVKDQRDILADALTQVGKFSALTADSVNQIKDNLVTELKDIGPLLQSVADAGPGALVATTDVLGAPPFAKSTLTKWMRGDYGNLTAVIDLTLSRIDAGMLTGTRFEGALTELELQWGRTIGQMPSPYTARNPLIAPYQFNQGP
ncbi:MCE family protein [Mycolicibacterium sp. XJ1819]